MTFTRKVCIFKFFFISFIRLSTVILILEEFNLQQYRFNISQPDMATLGSQMHWCLSLAILHAGCVKGLLNKQPDGVKMASLCGDVERSVVLRVDRGTQLCTTAILHKFLQLYSFINLMCMYMEQAVFWMGRNME